MEKAGTETDQQQRLLQHVMKGNAELAKARAGDMLTNLKNDLQKKDDSE